MKLLTVKQKGQIVSIIDARTVKKTINGISVKNCNLAAWSKPPGVFKVQIPAVKSGGVIGLANRVKR